MRGPGCCLGSCLGLLLGAALALGALAFLAREAPERFESAVRWATGAPSTRPAARGPAPDSGGPRAGTEASPGAASSSPPSTALERRVRERLRDLAAGPRTGKRPAEPVVFSQAEVQAALADPEGPLGGQPGEVRVELLPGRIRLSWVTPLLSGPRWLARPPLVAAASVDLAPRVEGGRLLCPVRRGKIFGLPLPPSVTLAVLRRLAVAPRLPPEEGFALPAGIAAVEVESGRVKVIPAQGRGGGGAPSPGPPRGRPPGAK